jgi:xylulokinase
MSLLGLDLSTQSLTFCLFPEGTKGAVSLIEPPSSQYPVKSYLKALDTLLKSLPNPSNIKAIGGAAQQHGSIYFSKNAEEVLKNLDPEIPLEEQIENALQISNATTWMDSSSTKQCHEIEVYIGGPHKLAGKTGSRAWERFTGPQIRKVEH